MTSSADLPEVAGETLREEVIRAQTRRIHDLERCLAERTRVLTRAVQCLIKETGQREEAQAAFREAQKLESVGYMIGGLAHDLRNVLNTLGMGFHLLKVREGDEVMQHVADSGRRALDQGDALIRSLLNFMRRGETQAELITPGSWLSDQEGLLRYAAGEGVQITLRVEDDVWPVAVERSGLSSALLNLTVNARDAMPSGGGLTLQVANLPRGAARPAALPDGDFVAFSVLDTGSGMSPEVLARAMEPLFSTKGLSQGTGLGLHMVDAFARTSGGHVQLTSSPGAGTRVDLYLPRSEGAGLLAPGPATSAPSPTMPAAAILLVVKDALLGPALAGFLREQGHQVRECPGAEAALVLIHTLPRLTLVIAETDLPGMDGAALILNLRQERPGLPALLIGGDRLSHSPLPGVPLLHRPLDLDTLATTVQERLDEGRSAPEKGAAILDRLLVNIHSPVLVAALLEWREHLASGPLPRIETLLGLAPDLADQRFLALPEGTPEDPGFRFLTVGKALTERFGRSLDGEPAGSVQEDSLGTLAAAYRRAVRSGLPTYEYARYALSDHAPVQFERLILPASEDGQHVSHLIGFVLFNDPAGLSTGETP
jgi:signal transduction histidine kinase/CheY-like chemotaxis protein